MSYSGWVHPTTKHSNSILTSQRKKGYLSLRLRLLTFFVLLMIALLGSPLGLAPARVNAAAITAAPMQGLRWASPKPPTAFGSSMVNPWGSFFTPTLQADSPQVEVKAQLSPDRLLVGQQAVVTVRIMNTGTVEATGISFQNDLPVDLEFIADEPVSGENTRATSLDAATGDVHAEVGVLAPNEVVYLHYRVQAAPILEPAQAVTDVVQVSVSGVEVPSLAEFSFIIADEDQDAAALEEGELTLISEGDLTLAIPDEAYSGEGGAVIVEQTTSGTNPAQAEGIFSQFEITLLEDPGLERSDLEIAGQQVEEALEETETASETAEVDMSEALDESRALLASNNPFDVPLELSVDFASFVDLSTLPADKEPIIVVWDETAEVWVRQPISSIDRANSIVTVETTHFSTWGAGLGGTFPTNGTSILLYDDARVSMFVGNATYSYPMWVPTGRSGMTPSVALSYSSGMVNGVLGDIQSSWVGLGWNIDSIEITRLIVNGNCGASCGDSATYGYRNDFILAFNGASHKLIADPNNPGRYYTEDHSFLYIQRHNIILGNPVENGSMPPNETDEWWEVVTAEGTRYRLGWEANSEQLAPMRGYVAYPQPGSAWANLGYAGHKAENVTLRWRVDLVTDVNGNTISYKYLEETRPASSPRPAYDRASYLESITYTGRNGKPCDPDALNDPDEACYKVKFVPENRDSGDGDTVDPSQANEWDTWDDKVLDKVQVVVVGPNNQETLLRTYDLDYEMIHYWDNYTDWWSREVKSIVVTGGSGSNTTTASTISFTYGGYANRNNNNGAQTAWDYPRLETISNGTEGEVKLYYESDTGRSSTASLNWRVWKRVAADGVMGDVTTSGETGEVMITEYDYYDACYYDPTNVDATWCSTSTSVTSSGNLSGYGVVRETLKYFNGTTRSMIGHHFKTEKALSGREWATETMNAAGDVYFVTQTDFTIVTNVASPPNRNVHYPTGVRFVYADEVLQYERQGSNVNLVSRQEFTYDSNTGELTHQKSFDHDDPSNAPYTQTEHTYLSSDHCPNCLYPGVATEETDGRLTYSGVWQTSSDTADSGGAIKYTDTIGATVSFSFYGTGFDFVHRKAATRGKAEVCIDNACWLTDDLYSQTAAFQHHTAFSNLPLGVHQVIIRQITRPGTNTVRLDLDAIQVHNISSCTQCLYPGLTEETDSRLTYSTGWSTSSSTSDSGGSVKETNTSNATVSFSFYGTGFTYVRRTASYYGKVDICIDSAACIEVDNYSAAGAYKVATAFSNLDPGIHQVVIRQKTNVANLDAIQVENNRNHLHSLPRSVITKNGSGTVIAATYYAYDGTDRSVLNKGLLTLQQTLTLVDAYQTIDTSYTYDQYGNQTSVRAHGLHGTLGWRQSPHWMDRVSTVEYDATYHTYPVKTTNPLGHATYTVYDFQLTGQLPLGLPRRVFDANVDVQGAYSGDPLQVPVSQGYRTVYDGLGRVTETYQPNTTGNANTKVIYPTPALNGEIAAPYAIELQIWDSTVGQYRKAWAFYDGWGRTIRTLGPAETSGHYIQTDTWYNSFGTVGKVSRPDDVTISTPPGTWSAPTWANVYHTETTFDAFGRATDVYLKGPSGYSQRQVTTQYDGRSTSVIDANGHMRQSVVDDFGRLISVKEYTGTSTYTLYSTTTYAYDARNLMTSVTDTLGNVTTISYDGLGRKTSMDDPDMGVWNYTYDIWGQILCQSDARTSHGIIRFTYDKLGRVTEREAGTSTTVPTTQSACDALASSLPTVATYTYDSTTSNEGVGRLTGMVSYYNGQVLASDSMVYNLLGQVTSTTRQVNVDEDGTYDYTFVSSSTYDSVGRVETQTLPDPDMGGSLSSETLTYSYNARGLFESVTSSVASPGYITQSSYMPNGSMEYQVLGNGVYVGFDYFSTTNRLQRMLVQKAPANALIDLNYDYDNVGNILTIADDVRDERHEFAYDHLDRLTSANICTGNHFSACSASGQTVIEERDYTYNSIGNLLTYQYNGGSIASYSYPTSGSGVDRPHAASAYNGINYAYDANGNMTQRDNPATSGVIEWTHTFDAENRLSQVSDGTTTTKYIYDGNGARLMRRVGSTTTLYVMGMELDLTVNTTTHSDTWNKTTLYYPMGGAFRVIESGDSTYNDTVLYYRHGDHLGSTSVMSNSSGAKVSGSDAVYAPFGEMRGGTSLSSMTDFGYTEQRLDRSTGGLMYYNARYYLPELRRFISADTIVPEANNPQAWNRYSYVVNNPLKYIDPTGHSFCLFVCPAAPIIAPQVITTIGAIAATVVQAVVAAPLLITVGLGIVVGVVVTAAIPEENKERFRKNVAFVASEVSEKVEELLMPDGRPIGRPGTKPTIRVVDGDLGDALELMDELIDATGAEASEDESYPGLSFDVPDAGNIRVRDVQTKSPGTDATIDLDPLFQQVFRIPFYKIKFVP